MISSFSSYCISNLYISYYFSNIVLEFIKKETFFSIPALPLCVGRLQQCDLSQSVLTGFRLVWLVVMASCLDNYWSQHFLCTAVPHKLCYISPGVAVVGHFCFTEELPACTGRTVPPSSGSPRLRDGRTVPQKTQNVDGTQSGQRGTNSNSYLQLLRTICVALFID